MILPAQNKRLHALLTKTGLHVRKSELVLSFTSGRSSSSKDLSGNEARELINYLDSELQKQMRGIKEKADKMRKKIISFAYQMNWTVPNQRGGFSADIQRINNWCLKSGYIKKPFNDFEYHELPKLVTQFENVYKSYLKSI